MGKRCPSVRTRALLAIGALLVATCALAQGAPAGLQADVVFTQVSPLSSNPELARRLLSPLAAARIPAILARAGKALAEQPVSLSQEKFAVFVPSREPPGGYGLMVFVPPWDEARLPPGWSPALDRAGMIFVSAERSGNGETDLGRRAPLALLAEQNIVRLYEVDPKRIYVGGFSGGSRVAMRLALAYPDVFRGALLNAGSDPVATALVPLPPRALFEEAQEQARLVYVTGDLDTSGRVADENSIASMRRWCVTDVADEIMAGIGHATPDASAFSRALEALERPAPPDPARLAACRSAIEARLEARLGEIEALIAAGKRDEAAKALADIDRRFGGLAAPRSLELEHELAGS